MKINTQFATTDNSTQIHIENDKENTMETSENKMFKTALELIEHLDVVGAQPTNNFKFDLCDGGTIEIEYVYDGDTPRAAEKVEIYLYNAMGNAKQEFRRPWEVNAAFSAANLLPSLKHIDNGLILYVKPEQIGLHVSRTADRAGWYSSYYAGSIALPQIPRYRDDTWGTAWASIKKDEYSFVSDLYGLPYHGRVYPAGKDGRRSDASLDLEKQQRRSYELCARTMDLWRDGGHWVAFASQEKRMNTAYYWWAINNLRAYDPELATEVSKWHYWRSASVASLRKVSRRQKRLAPVFGPSAVEQTPNKALAGLAIPLVEGRGYSIVNPKYDAQVEYFVAGTPLGVNRLNAFADMLKDGRLALKDVETGEKVNVA